MQTVKHKAGQARESGLCTVEAVEYMTDKWPQPYIAYIFVFKHHYYTTAWRWKAHCYYMYPSNAPPSQYYHPQHQSGALAASGGQVGEELAEEHWEDGASISIV